MNNSLKQFYDNPVEREAVKAFMIQVLEKRVVEKVFNNETIVGVYEAKNTINEMFEQLEEIYGQIIKTEITNSR